MDKDLVSFVTQRSINAPIEKVFNTVADIRQFSKAIPHIKDIEFLTEPETGLDLNRKDVKKVQSPQGLIFFSVI